MAFLTVDAYETGREFRREIKRQFGVSIKDESRAPWAVVFEGEREQLIAMYKEYWTEGDALDFLTDEAPAHTA